MEVEAFLNKWQNYLSQIHGSLQFDMQNASIAKNNDKLKEKVSVAKYLSNLDDHWAGDAAKSKFFNLKNTYQTGLFDMIKESQDEAMKNIKLHDFATAQVYLKG